MLQALRMTQLANVVLLNVLDKERQRRTHRRAVRRRKQMPASARVNKNQELGRNATSRPAGWLSNSVQLPATCVAVKRERVLHLCRLPSESLRLSPVRHMRLWRCKANRSVT
jgi:hypothetical protein